MLEREGAQTGLLLYARGKVVADFAKRAILGVTVCGCPSCPPMPQTQSFKSSHMISSTFGLSAAVEKLPSRQIEQKM